MITSIIEEVKRAQTIEANPWDASPFKDLITMTIDARGRVGEEIISRSFATTNREITEDITDVNDGNKYDMIVDGKVIEIKTAYRDKSNSWQHENVYKNAGVDYVIFVDFDYEEVAITFISTEKIPFGERNAIFGKKATLRGNKDDGYKLDFSNRTHENLAKAGFLKRFSPNATEQEIGTWLTTMM